jgi:hypothetical protein
MAINHLLRSVKFLSRMVSLAEKRPQLWSLQFQDFYLREKTTSVLAMPSPVAIEDTIRDASSVNGSGILESKY